MGKVKTIWTKNWPFFLSLIISLSLLWPLLAAPFFTHHDDVQTIRLFEMDKCFKDNQFPCRWVPDLGGEYGYPLFNYYAPLPYYFGELIYLLTNNLIISVKIMFATSFIGSFLFMYLLSRKLWGNLGGSLSALFYAIAPYHALDFYVRGAMGEMWGLMFYPATIWAFFKLQEKCNKANLLLGSVFIAALMISHNLSTMLFLPVIIFSLVILFLKKRGMKFLYFSIGSLLLGIMLSSFYFLPMLFEKDLVHVDSTTVGYFSYTEHFKGFKKLFLERSWGWGGSVREVPGGERDGLSYQIGWIHIIGWLLALYTAKLIWNKNRKISILIILSSLYIIFSIFMVNPRSEIIWKMIPPLKYLQFPWRFLLIIVFFTSFISGSFFIHERKNNRIIWIILTLLAIFFNFSYFRPEKFIEINDQELLSGKNWEKQIKRSIFDYLPIYAKEPPADLASNRYQILTGDSKVLDFKEGSNWLSFRTETNTHTIIRLSQYYFPDWKIFVDGKEIKVEYKNNSLGLMTIILGKGTHKIEGRLYDTSIRSISNYLTIAAASIVLFLFIIQISKVRKWISYYRKRIN